MSLLFKAIDSRILISCLGKTKYEVYNLSSKSATFETIAVIYGLRYYSSLEYAQRMKNDGCFLSMFIWIFELNIEKYMFVRFVHGNMIENRRFVL